MPKVVVLDKISIERIAIFNREGKWLLAIRYLMKSADADVQAGEELFELDGDRKQALKKFLKPCITLLRQKTDIEEIEDYTDPA